MKILNPNFIKNPNQLVESFFVKINKNDIAIWIKYTFLISNKIHQSSARIWFTFFERNHEPYHIHENYSMEAVKYSYTTLQILEHIWDFKNHIITGKLQNVTWEIQYKPTEETLFLLPYKFLYSNILPNMKIYTPIPSFITNGFITVNNQKFPLENAHGMFGHNWGKKHSYLYAWSHCNNFINKDHSFFEGFSAKLKIKNFISPYINMGIISLNGERIYFNSLRTLFFSNSNIYNNTWQFTLSNEKYFIEGTVEGKNFVYLKYLNPDGNYNICKNTKLANITLKFIKKSNLKNILLLKSNEAALEFLYPQNFSM